MIIIMVLSLWLLPLAWKKKSLFVMLDSLMSPLKGKVSLSVSLEGLAFHPHVLYELTLDCPMLMIEYVDLCVLLKKLLSRE